MATGAVGSEVESEAVGSLKGSAREYGADGWCVTGRSSDATPTVTFYPSTAEVEADGH